MSTPKDWLDTSETSRPRSSGTSRPTRSYLTSLSFDYLSSLLKGMDSSGRYIPYDVAVMKARAHLAVFREKGYDWRQVLEDAVAVADRLLRHRLARVPMGLRTPAVVDPDLAEPRYVEVMRGFHKVLDMLDKDFQRIPESGA